MRLKFLFTVSIILLGILTINAQNSNTLKGVVTTEQGEPIMGASIFLKGLAIGITTDFDGAFLLEKIPNKTYTIQVSYVGYNTITKEIVINKPVTVQNFVLKESSYMLEGVVVTSQKREQKIKMYLLQLHLMEQIF